MIKQHVILKLKNNTLKEGVLKPPSTPLGMLLVVFLRYTVKLGHNDHDYSEQNLLKSFVPFGYLPHNFSIISL